MGFAHHGVCDGLSGKLSTKKLINLDFLVFILLVIFKEPAASAAMVMATSADAQARTYTTCCRGLRNYRGMNKMGHCIMMLLLPVWQTTACQRY